MKHEKSVKRCDEHKGNEKTETETKTESETDCETVKM